MEAHPHFGNATPSTAVLQLIEIVETANPNSSDFSEDDINAQWGHKQLSGSWKGVLTDWDAVGSSDIAIRLLAALLKTCRVARFICSERRVKATSFLSDMYLDQIVDHLWKLWKDAGGVSNCIPSSFTMYQLTNFASQSRRERAKTCPLSMKLQILPRHLPLPAQPP